MGRPRYGNKRPESAKDGQQQQDQQQQQQQQKEPQPLRKAVFVSVNDLEPMSHGHNLRVQVVSAEEPVSKTSALGPPVVTRDALVGDASGCVLLQLRNEQTDLARVGQRLVVRNAKVVMQRGFMRLAVDKWGSIAADAAENPDGDAPARDNRMNTPSTADDHTRPFIGPPTSLGPPPLANPASSDTHSTASLPSGRDQAFDQHPQPHPLTQTGDPQQPAPQSYRVPMPPLHLERLHHDIKTLSFTFESYMKHQTHDGQKAIDTLVKHIASEWSKVSPSTHALSISPLHPTANSSMPQIYVRSVTPQTTPRHTVQPIQYESRYEISKEGGNTMQTRLIPKPFHTVNTSHQKDKPKRKPPVSCKMCGATETPEWRGGPDGSTSLCNACGLHYAKIRKREAKSVPLRRAHLPISSLLNHDEGDHETNRSTPTILELPLPSRTKFTESTQSLEINGKIGNGKG